MRCGRIMAYLDQAVDSRQDQDVRSVLRPFQDLAEQERVTVVVVRHLRKTSAGGNALYRGSGSIGFIGAARVGLLVASDPNNDRLRVLCQTKNNLGPLAPTLGYSVVAAGASCRIEWRGVVDVTAAQITAASELTSEDRGPRQDAEAFLSELLSGGPRPSSEVFSEARAAGVSDRTLKRAKASLGVRAHKLGGHFGGDPAWYWELPARLAEEGQPTTEEGQRTEGGLNKSIGTLQENWHSSVAEGGQDA